MPRSLAPEDEKMLWDKKELNMETSRGLSRTVIFYLIKCFAIWQGKELRQLDTSQVTFGEDDLGFYVALDLQKEKKKKKRYDDPANPRSIYKILKKYRSYVANEGPFLVRPITSIKDYICYSPLPLGVNVIERAVSTLTKDAGICLVYDNYSLNLQAVDTLIRFGTGSHCLAPWLYKNRLKGMPPAPTCGPTNCEDSNPEMSLMMSRLLDAPYPFDAVDMIHKMELDIEEPKLFDSWMTNLMSKKMKDLEKQDKETEKKKEKSKISNGKKLAPGVDKNEKNRQPKNKNVKKLSALKSGRCSGSSHSLSSGSKEDTTFEISCISSISEGAFSMQVDEAQRVETNTSVTAKKKRKQSTKSNDQQLSLKKLRPNSLNVSDSPQTRDNITYGNTDDAVVEWNKKTNECSNSHEISKSLVTEVKKEIITDDDVVDSEVENTSCLKSGSIFGNKITENSYHKVQSHCEMRCVGEESNNCFTQEASEPVNKEFTDVSDTCRRVLTAVNSTTILPKELKQLGGSPSCDKDLTNSVSVLQETLNDHYDSNRDVEKKAYGARDIAINSSRKEVEEDLFDVDEIPAICGDNIDCKDDSSVDEDNEFMIDLSPPVLSPQIPISSTDDHYERIDRLDKNGDEGGKEMKSQDSIRDKQYSFGASSSCSSSDIMRFLNNAQKQIRHLLEPSKNNTSSEESDEKDISTSIFDSSSKSKILSSTIANPCERRQFSCMNDDVNKTTVTSTESNSILSPPSSYVVQVQSKKKCSLLRTFLEKPKESITVSSSSSLSSLLVSKEQILSSLPSCTSLSKAPTSLLPKAIVYNTLSDSLPLQNSSSPLPSRSHIYNNKSDDKSSHSNVEYRDSQSLCPVRSNSSSSSSHLPVQIVLNKNESYSSSLSSSSNLPITLFLNPVPSSSVSSTQSLSCPSHKTHNATSSPSSSSSRLPSLSTSNTEVSTSCGPSTAIFHAKQDLKLNTLYQTLELGRPETEGSPKRYDFADIPNSSKPPSPSCGYRGGRIQTSEINLGDYFPPATLIPASSIRIITQQGQNGSEVVMRFGFNQNGYT